MIVEVDARLTSWAQALVGDGVGVSLAAPTDDGNGSRVDLYLMDLLNRRTTGNGRPPPHRVLLRYLVTVHAEDDTAAHDLLATLLFSALEIPDFEVEMETPPLALWTALGVRPRPAFVLRLPVTKVRSRREVQPVTRPLRVKQTSPTDLLGRVLGPGDVPIAAAHLELPGLARHTTTDSRGWFRFRTIPLDPPPRTLHISARGRSEARHWTEGIPLKEPLEIHLELEG